jgi:Zn-dependent protease
MLRVSALGCRLRFGPTRRGSVEVPMRDLMTWSLPLGRLFGVTIRIHVFFVVLMIGIVGRVAYTEPKDNPYLWVEAIFILVLLFFSILLHEFGHCFAARAVDGDAHEVLLWPLGGLAFVELPQSPRAHFITAVAGPAVNLLLCVIVCALLAAWSLAPSFNPLDGPFKPVLYNWVEDGSVASLTGRGDLWKFTGYKHGDEWVSTSTKPEGDNFTPVPLAFSKLNEVKQENNPSTWTLKETSPAVNVVAEPLSFATSFWLVQLGRLFWVNWVLLLINLLPAFPLDGGRMLQSVLWWRSDYRAGTLAAVIVGFVMMLFVIVLAIVLYDPLVLLLAYFIFLACRRQWILLETGGEESVFGYDFSQGYTSLEKDATGAPKKKPNFIQRWLQERAARKALRELERREAEEKRMDELLDKVQKLGLRALTDEERRFLQRVSARYRNRQ